MDHIALFRETNLACSKLITKRYSTSFSLSIHTLDRAYHDGIYAIYGFVRYADEIVDTFHQHPKQELLQRFKHDTYQAIDEKLSLNPVLDSFQWAVNKYSIDHELIEAFLHSMEMDLTLSACTRESYGEYIYGSAEVVGLMCLRVFLGGDHVQYEALKPYGRALGAAFQKVNFLRDLKSDAEDRGRIYFPNADFKSFDQRMKAEIEADIAEDFRLAYIGILRLPVGARLGVYLAYRYYLALFDKIKRTSAQQVANQRIRVPDMQKYMLLAQVFFRKAVNAW